jgi:hypothetical protein
MLGQYSSIIAASLVFVRWRKHLSKNELQAGREITRITSGAEFVDEYCLGKSIPVNDNWLFILSLCGNAYWQIADNSSDRCDDVDSQHKRSFALGTEFTMIHKPTSTITTLRTLREFGAIIQQKSQ